MTRFTINNTAVHNNSELLKELEAVAVTSYSATESTFDECHCGGNCNWRFGLPAATTFETGLDISRSQLKKRFGRDAMVRGVKKS